MAIKPTEQQWLNLIRAITGMHYFIMNQEDVKHKDTLKDLMDDIFECTEAIEAKEINDDEDLKVIREYYERDREFYSEEDALDQIREPIIRQLEYLGILPTKLDSHQQYHVGKSDYSVKIIQPWHIWLLYMLNPWDADLIKRILRTKIEVNLTPAEARILDYEKMKHVIDERIQQIRNGDPLYPDEHISPA